MNVILANINGEQCSFLQLQSFFLSLFNKEFNQQQTDPLCFISSKDTMATLVHVWKRNERSGRHFNVNSVFPAFQLRTEMVLHNLL